MLHIKKKILPICLASLFALPNAFSTLLYSNSGSFVPSSFPGVSIFNGAVTVAPGSSIYFKYSQAVPGTSIYFVRDASNLGFPSTYTTVSSGVSVPVALVNARSYSVGGWYLFGPNSFSNFASTGITDLCIGTSLSDCSSVSSGSNSSGSSNLLNEVAFNAQNLRHAFNIEAAALSAGLTNDCGVFDKNGVCLSTGGRYTSTNAPDSSKTSALLIGSLKYNEKVRLGGWIDQNISGNNVDGIRLANAKPMLGVFAVWTESVNGLGYQVKVSAGYGDKDLTVTRNTVNNGVSKLNTKGIQTVSSFGMELTKTWIAAPYVGLKYLTVTRNGYNEAGTGALAYSDLRQATTSAMAGVSFTGKIADKTAVMLSAGLEQDLSHRIGQYAGSDSSLSVTTNAFNSDTKRTRPSAAVGINYDLGEKRSLALNVLYRKEAFISTSTTSALATYTVGF